MPWLPQSPAEESSQGVRRVMLASLGVNAGLAVAKALGGWLGGSQALLADSLNSTMDTATDAAILVALVLARKPRDEQHPYGHHRLTTLLQTLLAGGIVVGAGLVFATSLVGGAARAVPEPSVLLVALLSFILKGVLYRATVEAAHRGKSKLLMANALNHRGDFFASGILVVALGLAHLGGAGWMWVDTGAALALAGYLVLEGVKLLLRGLGDLMDQAPEQAVINDLREHVLPTHGVLGYHQFRARPVGDMWDVDLHVQVQPTLSVAEGHEIARAVRENLMKTHPEVLDVLVHIEPATEEHLRERGVSDWQRSI